MPTYKKIDLNKIPSDWIRIDEDGKLVIENPEFAALVKDALDDDGDITPARNGGCDCPTNPGS